MGRLRKTFSSNGSSSPVKTIKRLCKGSDDNADNKNAGAADVDTLDVIEATHTACPDDVSSSPGLALHDTMAVVTNDDKKSVEDTILEHEIRGSPKIVLTTPNVPDKRSNGEMSELGSVSGQQAIGHSRKAIEIVQDNDQITVVVKGDVRIESSSDGHQTPKRFVISSNPRPAAHSADDNYNHKPSNGHLQPQDQSSPENQTDGEASDTDEGRMGGARNRHSGGAQRGERRGSATSPKRFAKVHNLLDNKTFVDVLHQKVIEKSASGPLTATCLWGMTWTDEQLTGRHLVYRGRQSAVLYRRPVQSLAFNTTYTPQRFEVVCVCFHSLCCQPKQSVCLCVSPEHDLHPREVHGVVDEHSREDRATQERGGPAGASQGLH
ncbi:hypothetical protein C0Q70_08609 [Pomacea canaliculata]|uniref:Uncharacterized protein n=1 Tax=Pomacea canaliculata TaxID=400727 RepID=A0A2T7PIF1_POMCA|nr:hypothetical protein C0Q70_08609 [Pomacea canaliculata]